MKLKFGIVVLFLTGLVLLQQGIAFGSRHSPHMQSQANLVVLHDIDPSALFYMESKLALKAEKEVRRSVNSP